MLLKKVEITYCEFSMTDGEIVFSRKFMVLERLLGVEVEIKRSRKIKTIDQQQVVQFKINSPNLLLINPKAECKNNCFSKQ